MLAEIVKQVELSERLLETAQQACSKVRGLRSGDRVYTPLVATAEFQQGTAPSQNLIFNVPADADFWAYRLCVYPYCKVVDPVNLSGDEIVYRSTSYPFSPSSPGLVNVESTYTDFYNLVDGTFALIYDGKELQNTDVPLAATYCANTEKWVSLGASVWSGATQTPAGLVFDVPMFIPRGRALTLRITPTYLGVRSIADAGPITRQHKYKIVAVLEGEKKVTAFR